MPEQISALSNATDSLRRLASELSNARTDPMALKAALWWGLHAALLLAHARLRPAREQFDHWFWDYLDAGQPALEVDRDARWEERQRLSLLEVVDVLSEEGAPLLKPEFYQGWQDRTSRCRTLRRQVREVLGVSLSADQSQDLLWLLAAYHRLLRLPADVELETSRVAGRLPALLALIELLIDPEWSSAGEISELVGACREA